MIVSSVFLLKFLLLALVEEVITCHDATVTFRTYAHAAIDRVLVTELHIERGPGNPNQNVTIHRNDLGGEENWDDFSWNFEVEVAPLT